MSPGFPATHHQKQGQWPKTAPAGQEAGHGKGPGEPGTKNEKARNKRTRAHEDEEEEMNETKQREDQAEGDRAASAQPTPALVFLRACIGSDQPGTGVQASLWQEEMQKPRGIATWFEQG